MLRERFLTVKPRQQRPAMRSAAIAGGRRRRQLNRGGMVASSLIFVGICFLAWERSAGVVHDDDNEAATSTDIESLVAADCVSSIVLRKRGFRLIGVLKRGRWGLINKAVRQSDGAPFVVKEIGGPLTAHAHHFSVQAIAHEYEMQRRAAPRREAPPPPPPSASRRRRRRDRQPHGRGHFSHRAPGQPALRKRDNADVAALGATRTRGAPPPLPARRVGSHGRPHKRDLADAARGEDQPQ